MFVGVVGIMFDGIMFVGICNPDALNIRICNPKNAL